MNRLEFCLVKILYFILSLCLAGLSGSIAAHNLPDSKSIIIEGVVFDRNSNETLTGALVRIPGTDYSTLTDEDGYFKIELYSTPAAQIEISLVSFFATTIDIAQPCASGPMNISLIEK